MPNVQSPTKYQSIQNNIFNRQSTPSLPKLLPTSLAYNEDQSQYNQRNHYNGKMRKSLSVAAIIHGDSLPKSPNNHHYVDQLQRFKRDYASKEKQERQNKRQNMIKNIERKRNLQFQRQKQHRQRQQNYVRKIVAQNEKAMQVYKTGFVKNSFAKSIPVNPINLKYDDSLKGRYQKQVDDQMVIKNLVRTHHLQTCGTSGYNIINGARIDYTQKLLPRTQQSYKQFGQNLQRYYSKFTMKPPSEQQLIDVRKGKNVY